MEIGNFEKPLGVHVDDRLTLDYHISGLCKKAGKKFDALARVSQYMNLSKAGIQRLFCKKAFSKYAANLQKKNHGEV